MLGSSTIQTQPENGPRSPKPDCRRAIIQRVDQMVAKEQQCGFVEFMMETAQRN